MPVDSLKKGRNLSRHSVLEKDGMKSRERELRRARGEIACAECKRLKLRCDRVVPCSSCVRRGRPSVCPNGISVSRSEDRGPLLDFIHIRHRFKDMGDRIRQLEDALEILQKTQTESSHPLLSKTLLKIKNIDDIFGIQTAKDVQVEGSDDDIELSLGTLTISESGISRFLGRSGGAESLMLHEIPSDSSDDNRQNSSEVDKIVNAMPFINPGNTDSYLQTVLGRLPSWERASSLCEIYLEHCSWYTRPIKRDQLINELLPTVYKRNSSLQSTGFGSQDKANRSVHAAADEVVLLLMVFAVGALGDLILPPCNDEAEEFFQMARSIGLTHSIIENPTLSSIQALILMAAYVSLSSRLNSLDAFSSMISLACGLSKSMGLHRDPAQWNLDPKIIDRRRNVFWELFLIDNLQGIYTGRPPTLSVKYVDTEFPEDTNQYTDENGNISPSFWHWKYIYAKKVVFPLNEKLTTVGPIKYSEILKIDSDAHESLIIPPHLKIPPGGSSWESDSPGLIMGRFVISISRDILTVHVHRSFFAKALLDFPNNPLKSPYAHSFLSAYNSALSLLKSTRIHYDMCPALISRFFSTWSHAFSATVILGSTVIRAPSSELTPTALLEFGHAIDLFQSALNDSPRAKRAMPILLRLRDKVYRVYSRTRYGSGSIDANSMQKDWESELGILAGKTNLFVTKEHVKVSVKSQRNSSNSTNADSDSPASAGMDTTESQSRDSFTAPYPSYGIADPDNDNEAVYRYLGSFAEYTSSGPVSYEAGLSSWMYQMQGPSTSLVAYPPPYNPSTPEQQQAFSQLTNNAFSVPDLYMANFPAQDTNNSQYSSNAANRSMYPSTTIRPNTNVGQVAADEAWISLMQDSEMLNIL